MAAQIDLDRRGEPAQVIIGLVALRSGTVKAVSLRLFSAAIACSIVVGQPFGRAASPPPDCPRTAARQRHRPGRRARWSSAGSRSDRLGSMVSRSVWPCGVEVDEDFGAREARLQRFLDRGRCRSCASRTVQSPGTQTWNWTKSCDPLVRVRRSWRPASSGYSAAAARKAARCASGHSRSINWSIACARRAPRAPNSSHAAISSPNTASAPTSPSILVEHQRGDHRSR